MILLDTSGLLAALDSSQRQHRQAVSALHDAHGPLVLSPFVLAELDYLLATRVGPSAALSLLAEVARGAYRLESFDAADVAAAHDSIEAYGDLDVGLADASIVVLPQRYETTDVLTLDQRHFRTLRGPGDGRSGCCQPIARAERPSRTGTARNGAFPAPAGLHATARSRFARLRASSRMNGASRARCRTNGALSDLFMARSSPCGGSFRHGARDRHGARTRTRTARSRERAAGARA